MPKLLRISGLHGYNVQQAFLQAYPNAEDMDYVSLRDGFKGMKTLYSGSFDTGMRTLGWEVEEVFYDFDLLQGVWATENDIDSAERDHILMAQIQTLRPDAVFCENISWVPEPLLTHRKQAFPSVRVLAAQQGFPMHYRELVHADVVFTCVPSIVNVFRSWGIKSHLVYYSFDPTIAEQLNDQDTKEHGFVFSGHSGYGFDWHHRTRYESLTKLLDMGILEAWLTERDRTLNPAIETPLRQLYPELTHDPVYGLDMYRLLQSSHVVLNSHTDAAWGYSGNMRLFEAAGIGACQIVEQSINIAELYVPDEEVVTFSSVEECAEKVGYLLDNPAQAAEIGQRAAARTLKDHANVDRCETMNVLLRKELGA